ncbi:magnesium transporter CorA family protein [Aerococcaceae bacterium WGS1372]
MLIQQTFTYKRDNEERSFDFYQLWQARPNEVQKLKDQYQIPEDFITSGLDSYEIARWESYTNPEGEEFSLCVFNYPFKDDTEDFRNVYRISPISIVIKPGLVLITSLDSLKAIDDMTEERLGDLQNQDELGVLLTILWFVARLYVILLQEIDREIHALEMDVTKTTRNDIFYRLMKLNKGLVFFNSGIDHNIDVLENLKKRFEHLEVDTLDARRLRDVNVELHQASGMVNELMQLNSKVSDILSSVVNNNMNQIMKILTVWSITLTVPTIISGVWGMNVPLPGEDNGLSLYIISVVTLILMIIIYWLFKRNRWL